MAILTDIQILKQWQTIFRKGVGKEELKADGLPDRATRKKIFQALEDWYESERMNVKGLLISAKGSPMSNAAARKYARAYLQFKFIGE